MKTSSRIFKTRTTRPGPENRLLQAALRRGLPIGLDEALILREPELPTGVPDLIAIEPRLRLNLVWAKRRQFQKEHFQVLHFINESGSVTADNITRLLNQPFKKTYLVLQDLVDAGLVVQLGHCFVVQMVSKVFVAKRIVAVEAKVRAWRQALEQAVANLWFASHSYILVPALNCLRSVCEEAKKFGIGVLVFDGKHTRTALRSRKQPIPASYGSWLINEWAIGQLK